jgi:hypothetical protein
MKFNNTWNVARWRGDVEIQAPRIRPAIVLALIHVESAGDEFAQRPGSQFNGLLQMGKAAGVDVGFRDVGKPTTSKLKGDGPAAIRAFAAYVSRYESFFGDDSPEWVALLWKGGPGYAKKVKALVGSGMVSFDDAVAMIGDELGFSATEYIERFRAAFAVWSKEP